MEKKYFIILFSCLMILKAESTSSLDGSSTMVSGLTSIAVSKNYTHCSDTDWSVPDGTEGCFNTTIKGIVKCNDKNALILDCHCASKNNNETDIVVGACFYNCVRGNHTSRDRLYSDISNNVCKKFNREGIFCGQCVCEHYPLAYSFDLTCIKCDSDRANWVIFFLIATIPSTVFFFIIIIFKINITSSYIHGFVIFSQAVSIPASMRIILLSITSTYPHADIPIKVIASFYGFWNLDFLRPLLPQNCLRLNTLESLSLDYVVAVYPLFLVILSYILAVLYYRNVKIIVIILHPVYRLFSRFQRTWNIKSSIVDAYTTFFLLSYAKFLSVSFDILVPTKMYSISSGESHLHSYYDANLKYFQGLHLHFALLALIVLIIFVFIPTLIILLYPFRYCQVIFKNSLLDLFTCPFYRCFKDGTEPNTHDCRWVSALFLILRIIFPTLYAITLGSVYLPLAVIVIFILVMALITLKPYKPMYSHFLKFDVTFLLLLALFYLSLISIDVSSVKDHRLVTTSYIMSIIFGIVPMLYIIFVVIHWIVIRRNYGSVLVRRIRAIKFTRQERSNEMENSIPDRLLHPTEYMSNSASVNINGSDIALSKATY